MKFKTYELNNQILETLDSIRFYDMTSIQEKVLPVALKGKDIIGRSPTGSGKTHSFLIPIFNNLDLENKSTQAIIIVPTRELAMQIYDMALPFIEKLNVKTRVFAGGTDRVRLLEENTSPQLIIGTPGRIKDIAFDSAVLNITNATTLVLDEADMVLESGFLDEVGFILQKMKKHVQLMVFSATLPEQLQQFLRKYMKNPVSIDADKTSITSKSVLHVAYPTRNRDKLEVLKYLCESINPYLCLIFASRKEDVDTIYRYLKRNEFDVGVIHGDLDSTTRKTMMKRIRNDEFRYIVASDIAARGIDIEGVTHVINYNLPYEEDFYFHRAGRTGRNNADGVCFTLYDKEEVKYVLRFVNKGVKFVNREYKNGKWVDLKPLVKQMTPKKKDSEVQKKINKTININKNQKVKPGYKKKLNKEIEKIKQKHRREVIKKDIERQKKARYIAQSKAMKGE